MTAKRSGSLSGRHVVITAGPTREFLDAIRFLSNASTGRMGIELARGARERGAQVTLVLGPTSLRPPQGVAVVRVGSTQDLLRATKQAGEGADAIVFSAAPSDFRPRRRRRGKPARIDGAMQLDLVPTSDVAAALGRRKGHRIHVGFALEVAGGASRARAKLARKNFDAIVLNGPQNFGAGGGPATWIDADGTATTLSTASKRALARSILTRLAALFRTRARSGR